MTTDAAISEMLKRAPLVRFSPYSQVQIETVQKLSAELIQNLDQGIQGHQIDGQTFQCIYGDFWLWVLGAYEVTRTMSEYKNCFSGCLNTAVSTFKRSISILRIPFAKQQFMGHDKRPINGEASVYKFDLEKKDLAFEVEGKVVWMRELINEFESLVRSIKPEDVLLDLRASHQREADPSIEKIATSKPSSAAHVKRSQT